MHQKNWTEVNLQKIYKKYSVFQIWLISFCQRVLRLTHCACLTSLPVCYQYSISCINLWKWICWPILFSPFKVCGVSGDQCALSNYGHKSLFLGFWTCLITQNYECTLREMIWTKNYLLNQSKLTTLLLNTILVTLNLWMIWVNKLTWTKHLIWTQ